MNEIILNGTSSTELQGLIIQTLPPIAKPKMRTRTEEIDGRDGDIVTKLGYSAYEKSFNIGLSYDYDVDEIIAFFNSSGTVTFSSEPDKYYKYQILEQIDFERLIRFKTATVKMHVQPFKYSNIEVEKKFLNNLLKFENFEYSTNGITVSLAQNGLITVEGNANSLTEFHIPINTLNIPVGTYTLRAYSNGTGVSSCGLRLIHNTPSTGNTFGFQEISLQNGESISLTSTTAEPKEYNFLYLKFEPNVEVNFALDVNFNSTGNTFKIRNSGNYFSRPIFNIHGAGQIKMAINSHELLTINLGLERNIQIDTEKMYASTDGILKNRLVIGDYENVILSPGKNTIFFDGHVSSFFVKIYSRWV